MGNKGRCTRGFGGTIHHYDEHGKKLVAVNLVCLEDTQITIVDDKAKYTDWSTRDDIKANLQVDLILLLNEFDYPPVTIDDVYKEVLEQTENFKKYTD